ncbi:hypothetical protein GH5_00923 [Leishmania sp. Ghana 2012 LV757]|uniref:hypothetical protein n=1 Tax=Leishmania sp. Ghana 2012 LV757 TaxID=2803181 RepID=UPI001B42BC7B|nr:hypothetical protein GH5_00923 [Leishmania sp. Ghana 2012 LV757]
MPRGPSTPPGGRRQFSDASTGAVSSACTCRCFLRATLLLVYFFLLSTSTECGAAAHRASAPAGAAASAEGAESITDLSPEAYALAAQQYAEEHLFCPALPFFFYVAAATGTWSQIDRLVRCPSTRSSTVLDDIKLSREARESGDTLLSVLWRLARGIREEHVFYDNAAEFIALEAEIKRFVRVSHTIGMHPPHYGDVLSTVADILDLNLTADLLPSHGDGPLPIMADGPGMEIVDLECEKNPVCLQQRALNEYRRHANRTLEASPHLIVSYATFARAMAYYRKNLVPSIVVRAYDLTTSSSNSFQQDLAGLLRTVQHMWDTATREVESEHEDTADKDEAVAAEEATITDSRGQRRAAPSSPQPLLPFIKVTDFTGPPQLNRVQPLFFHDRPEPPSRGGGGTRQRPLHRVLPTAIVYHASSSCASCEVYDRAFDLLPSIFKGLCNHPHSSMVSCSPLTLFLRTAHTSMFDLVPFMDIYARTVHSREAVLRAADTGGFFFPRSSADGVDDDAADDAHFYSLQSKYRSRRYGIEREVLPRDKFTPIRIFLRHISNVASVEDVLTSMFTELVEHGVVQFAFMRKSQLKRILKKNQEVRERLKHRQREGEEDTRNDTDAAAASSPPAPNPEADPEYQKVVTFHDLATELVSSYTRAHFGDVSLPASRRERTRHRTRSTTTSSSWLLSPLMEAAAALWDCILFELECPLVPILFLLMCAAQLWWNRAEQVSYW